MSVWESIGLFVMAAATAVIFIGPALGAHGWLNIVHWAVGFGFGIVLGARYD